MLISHPILGLEPTQLFDQERLDHLGGTYPVTSGLLWHGGVHVTFPATGGNEPRAIASGKVVAFRMPTAKPSNADELKNHPLNYQGWTDDGFVLLKHEKESGEATKVVFYSLYMHLSAMGASFKGAAGAVIAGGELTVKRKQILGKLGSIDGQGQRMHFEIFTDDESFNKFFKRGDQPYVVDANGNGEKDLWGDSHFVIPAGTSYQVTMPSPAQAAKPASGKRAAIPEKPYAPPETPYRTAQELCVTVRYSKGDRNISSYSSGGELIGELTDSNAEYDIYADAKRWFPKDISAGYELLRHGRLIGPDDLPAVAPNWKRLPVAYGRVGYVDLNQVKIKKISDADFPPWLWRCIAEGSAFSRDNKCDIVELINKELNHDGSMLILPLEITDLLSDPDCKKKLQNMICRFPSEWDSTDNELHWAWVKTYFANPLVRATEIAKQRVDWISEAKIQAETNLKSAEELLTKVKDDAKESDLAPHLQKRDQSMAKLTVLEPKVALIGKDKYKPVPPKKTTDPKPATKEEILADYDLQKENIKDAEEAINNLAVINDQHLLAIKRLEKKILRLKATIQAAPAAKAKAESEYASAKIKSAASVAPKQVDIDKAWGEFKAHLEALQWWKKIPGMPDSNVWHFHPIAFIKLLKKCHWLSVDELKLAYFDSETAILEKHYCALNTVMYKYGVVTPARQACFLGQGAQESGQIDPEMVGGRPRSIAGLSNMLEGSNAPYRNASKAEEVNGYYNDPQDIYYTHIQSYDSMSGNVDKEKLVDVHGNAVSISGTKAEKYLAALKIDKTRSTVGDGVKFRGRGMKQLTGRYNYVKYWVYRGWLNASDFKDPWWNTEEQKLSAPQIPDPHRICANSYNCIDTGGWFWEAGKSGGSINKQVGSSGIVDAEIVKSVTKAINGAATEDAPSYLNRRRPATLYIFNIFGDNI